jgi:hypothetical protein
MTGVEGGAAAKGAFGEWGKLALGLASKPALASMAKGAGLAGGTILADHLTSKIGLGSDTYGLSTVGVSAAFAAPIDYKYKAAIAASSLIGGKLLNHFLPADEHPELQNVLAPGFTDTALMTGALFLPTSNKYLPLAAVGGAYVFGRMNHVDGGKALIGAGAIWADTFALTRNAELSTGVAAASWVASRVVHYF